MKTYLFGFVLACSVAAVLSSTSLPLEFVEEIHAQLQQLKEEIRLIKQSHGPAEQEQNKILQQQQEISELKATVTRLASVITTLRSLNDQERRIDLAATTRSCEELRLSDPTLKSGMYWVDPDGHSVGDVPIFVYCNMTSGSTSVLHDSEATIDVGHCWDSGCYSRSVSYNATMRQMVALMELSAICTQSIQYECKSAPLEFNTVPQSWWTDRHGIKHYDFTGGQSTRTRCQCSLEKNCLDDELECNCNSVSPVDTVDTGLIMDKGSLPVTRLNFGRILTPPASGRHTLGRLQCFGRQFISPAKPNSCQDLWRSGHTLSGFYPVQRGEAVEVVYCDMTQVPGLGNTVSVPVQLEKFEEMVKRIERAELSIRQQNEETNNVANTIQRVNETVAKKNKNLCRRIDKLETSSEKMVKEMKTMATGEQKRSAELADLKKQAAVGRSIRRMPLDCKDLRTIGHSLSGIYPIKGVRTVDMVYCDMATSEPTQTLIGSVDVKSSPVHFYVQRNTSLFLEGVVPVRTVLTFDVERINVGGGMDIKTGVFTAPKTGPYVFSFSAIKRDKAKHVNVYLYLNDAERVASVYGSQHEGYFTLSLQSILPLREGDSVKLVVESTAGGGIYDDKDMTTNFSGFMLDEEIF